MKKFDNYIVLVLAYTFNKPFCETSFVSGFFPTFMKKSWKYNVMIWVEYFNFIFIFKKTPPSISQ